MLFDRTGEGETGELQPHVREARRRSFLAFVCVALGVAIGRGGDGSWPAGLSWSPAVWFGLGAFAAGVAAISKGRWCAAALLLAVICLSAGWSTHRLHRAALPELISARDATPAILTLEGVVLDTPEFRPPPREGLMRFVHQDSIVRFPMRTDAVLSDDRREDVGGWVWVRLRKARAGDVGVARAGQRVRVTGVFAGVGPPTNPGESDMRLWASQEGFGGSVTVPDASLVQPASSDAGIGDRLRASWSAARAALRDRARAVLTKAAGDRPGSEADVLVRGLVLGDSDAEHADVQAAFARQGLAHILAISGFHLIVLARLTLALVRLTGERGWLESAIVGTLVVVYTLIVPPGSPIVRSAALVLVFLVAQGFGRRYDRLTLLGWIGVGLLIWRPLDLFTLGFQLSLGLTAMLFWAARPFHDAMFVPALLGTVLPAAGSISLVRSAAGAFVRGVKEAISTSTMCWLTALPTVVSQVGVLSPLAILASVVVTPVIVLVLWVGYLALFVGLLAPGAAGWAGSVLRELAEASVGVVKWFDALPWSSVPAPPVSMVWAGAATAVLAVLSRHGGWAKPRALVTIAALIAWWVGAAMAGDRLPAGVALRVDTLDVGSGSCHLVRSGEDALLWDAAPMRGGGMLPAGVRAIRGVGAWRVPKVVITHPDTDHFAGIEPLLRPLGVREAFVCERFLQQAKEEPRGAAAAALEVLAAHGVTVRTLAAGDSFPFGEGVCRVISPAKDAAFTIDNDHSLVAEFSVPTMSQAGLAGEQRRSLVMTGDIQDEAVRAIVEREPGLAATVLELPHHGSARPGAIAWTRDLRPTVVLQSTNRQRLNDPRWSAVREALQGQGGMWMCTAERGAVWTEIRRDGTVRTGSIVNPATAVGGG